MAAMQGLQSDLFGGVDETQTVAAVPPMLAAQSWQMPEAEAFVAALRRGALNDAVAVLNRLKINTAWKVLLETGFQVGGTASRAEMMAPAQRDIIEAAQRRITGHELRHVRVAAPLAAHEDASTAVETPGELVTIESLNRELASLERVDPFSPGFDRARAVKTLLADGLARELPDGVVLAKTLGNGARQGAVISREPDDSGEWRVSWFDERGFSGDGRRGTYPAAILDTLRDGYRDTNRGLLDELSTLESFHAGNAATVAIREENEQRAQEALERQTQDAANRAPEPAIAEIPSWHTALPEAGMEIEDADETGAGYRLVGSRIARDAVNAVTQDQTMNGGTMFAYVLPAANGYHGRVRLLPEDQKAPDGWALLDRDAIPVGYLTKDQQVARIMSLLGSAAVIGSRVAAPAKTAEEAIRKAFRALPDKTIGKVQPMTVTFGGVSRNVLAYANNPPSIANQRRGLHTPIHFSTVAVGRLAAGDPIRSIVNTFTLDGRDNVKEIGRARYATAEDLKQWMDAGFADPMQGQMAERTAYVPVTDDSHPAPIPRVSISGLSDAERTKWVDLHRQQHELQYKDLRKVQKDMEAVRTPMHKAETRYKEMLAGAENAADALKKGLPGGERHDDYVIAANQAAEEFSRHSSKLEVLQFKHRELFDRIRGFSHAKDAILPDSGDLQRDLASGERRNDAEEALYAKEQAAKYMKVRRRSSEANGDEVAAVTSAGDELPAIPEHVKQRLTRLLAPAVDTAAALVRARQTDVQFHGEGRYAAETWLDRKDSLAKMNDTIKDTLEGIPDLANREMAREYLAENMPDVNLTAQEKGYFRETAEATMAPIVTAPVSMEQLVKVAADSIGELRKVDVLRVLESNHRNVELAQYIAKERPDLATEVDEVMVEEFGIRGWKGGKEKPVLVTADMLVTKGVHVGTVANVTEQHVIQDVGRGKLVAHERAAFDVVPVVDAMMTVGYKGGRVAAASVVGPARLERGR